ncbi:hypothetical protein [Blastococcus sp. SYSU DS0616]
MTSNLQESRHPIEPDEPGSPKRVDAIVRPTAQAWTIENNTDLHVVEVILELGAEGAARTAVPVNEGARLGRERAFRSAALELKSGADTKRLADEVRPGAHHTNPSVHIKKSPLKGEGSRLGPSSSYAAVAMVSPGLSGASSDSTSGQMGEGWSMGSRCLAEGSTSIKFLTIALFVSGLLLATGLTSLIGLRMGELISLYFVVAGLGLAVSSFMFLAQRHRLR